MPLTIDNLIKDLKQVDVDDILSCWQWRVADMKAVVLMTVLGDLFLLGHDEAVYRLQTDGGELTKVADTLDQFEEYLTDDEKIDEWFLPLLVEKLLQAGKTLKDDEVYSYNTIPVIGGEYSVDNIKPTDMSVHFALTGQVCEQIKDLPDGTKVRITIKK